MKKYLYIALAAAALTSCSSDDTLDVVQGEEIQFGGGYIENSTRAAIDPSYHTGTATTEKPSVLTSFNVYGTVEDVNIFNASSVTKGNAAYGAAWTCTATKQYWVAGADYIFDAVVDATEVYTDANGLPSSLKYDASTQKDMLHDRVTTTGQPAEGLVKFNFTHLLSKVKFTVSNKTTADAANYQLTVTDIIITDAYATGNYAVVEQTVDNSTVAAGSWYNTTVGTHAIADMTVASNSIDQECEKEVLLIPGANVGISFNINVQIKTGDTWKTLTTVPVNKTGVKTLVANNAYNFKVEYAIGGEIQFTAEEMPEWTTDGNTITVQ